MTKVMVRIMDNLMPRWVAVTTTILMVRKLSLRIIFILVVGMCLSGCTSIKSKPIQYHIEVRMGTPPEEIVKLGIVPDGTESRSLIQGEILLGRDFTLTNEGVGTMTGKLYRDMSGRLHLAAKYSDNKQGSYFDSTIELGKPLSSNFVLGSGIFYFVYVIIR